MILDDVMVIVLRPLKRLELSLVEVIRTRKGGLLSHRIRTMHIEN